MGVVSKPRKTWWPALAIVLSSALAASAQTPPAGGSPPTGPQTEKPSAPETAPAKPTPSGSPLPQVAVIGPAREIKLADYTWFRFGAQVQLWYKAAQDRIVQPGGGDGTYAMDFYCRRCRFFATGSVVRNVFFNVLFEAGNLGKADTASGVKTSNGVAGPVSTPQILDAYGQVKFADAFWLSGGNILMPLTRNGTQPTTTYVSIDNANIDTTPVLQGNSYVLRDLGIQANGYFLDNHLEYRAGMFQGSRQAATATQTASHNAPRFVGSLMFNFWDPEVGYVNGGHYYGTKRVLGVMVNGDYQQLRKDAPGFPAPGSTTVPAAGTAKDAYYGLSAAAFINLPLTGSSPRGGDEIVGLLQFGYYDGGFKTTPAGATTNPGTYPNVLKQTNYLAELGYYNHSGHFSVFGKYEMRKVSDDYVAALRLAQNQTWMAAGVKYYVGPANTMNFGLQYERVNQNSTDLVTTPQQGGTNNLTFQMQTILY
jgi:hypothetical protein